jgi:hypothetical protein
MGPNRRENAFEGGFRDAPARFSGHGIVTIIVLLLLLPKAPSVLCIAPGSHIAIESMNASCCAKPAISHQNINLQENGFVAAGDCLNCTDFFIESDGSSAVLDSFLCVAPDQLASATRGNYISTATSFLICQSSLSQDTSEGYSIPSSPPLRC